MTVRDKLIKLIEQAYYCSIEELADYLIAAGITIPTGEVEFDYSAEDI